MQYDGCVYSGRGTLFPSRTVRTSVGCGAHFGCDRVRSADYIYIIPLATLSPAIMEIRVYLLGAVTYECTSFITDVAGCLGSYSSAYPCGQLDIWRVRTVYGL